MKKILILIILWLTYPQNKIYCNNKICTKILNPLQNAPGESILIISFLIFGQAIQSIMKKLKYFENEQKLGNQRLSFINYKNKNEDNLKKLNTRGCQIDSNKETGENQDKKIYNNFFQQLKASLYYSVTSPIEIIIYSFFYSLYYSPIFMLLFKILLPSLINKLFNKNILLIGLYIEIIVILIEILKCKYNQSNELKLKEKKLSMQKHQTIQKILIIYLNQFNISLTIWIITLIIIKKYIK